MQEANRFYETVKGNQTHTDSGMHSPRRSALAGRLDEYGDIRSRPRAMSAESGSMQTSHQANRPASSSSHEGEASLSAREFAGVAGNHDFETDLFQWPFIDASWSAGFDAGLDGLWHNSGLFDPDPSL